jgi:uncharacterized protein YjbJ (UPF0337 family)
MNWKLIEGNWKQFKDVVKGQWDKLAGDRGDEVDCKRYFALSGKSGQETYGAAQNEAEE